MYKYTDIFQKNNVVMNKYLKRKKLIKNGLLRIK